VQPSVRFTMRSANRAPKPNYLARTVASLLRGGMSPADIHVFPTDPDVAWIGDVDMVTTVHAPERRRTPNENGLAPIDLLDSFPADWILLTEDDLEWCDDPIGSVQRWLVDHARPDVLVYRFFAFDRLVTRGPGMAEAPLREQKGSQAIALRADDARRLAHWAMAHATTWRPKAAPFQDRPHDGFDKLVGYWALQAGSTVGLVSQPFFVKHIGLESSLHQRTRQMDAAFRPEAYGAVSCR
jgi:hypothetical protein